MQNELKGKIAEVLFETGYHFKLEYLEGNKMRWSSLKEEEKDNTAIEDIHIHKINDGQYSINWIEKTGISVSHVIDINAKTVSAYMNWNDANAYGGRRILTHRGTYHFINNDLSVDTLAFTNLEKAKDFWNRFFNKHDSTAIDDYLAAPYTQHNPYVPDGIDAFKGYFVEGFKNDLKNWSSEIKSIHSSGDLVYIHNLVKSNSEDKGSAAIDIFRFENGKIVEHWDVIQPMPESSANDHPMF